MPNKKEMTEEEAFKLFQEALRGGQASLDRLPAEVKVMAMGPAEKSLERSDLPPRPADELAAPDPDERKDYKERESYKGFRMPKGMSPEQQDDWKSSIDEGISKSS